MTREEQILNAAREYNNGIIFSNPSNVLHFEAGAKWADEHPKFENAWHDAYEEPKKGEYILVEVVNTLTPKNEIGYYVEYTEDCVVNVMKTEGFKCRWACVKDLLPKFLLSEIENGK